MLRATCATTSVTLDTRKLRQFEEASGVRQRPALHIGAQVPLTRSRTGSRRSRARDQPGARLPGILRSTPARDGGGRQRLADATSAHRSDELAAEYVDTHLTEFEPTRTGVTGGDVLASRVMPAMLDAAHRWRAHRVHARRASQASPVLVVGATGGRDDRSSTACSSGTSRFTPSSVMPRGAARSCPRNARQFVGDLRRRETLAASMEGVSAMIVATCGGAEQDNSPVLVDYFGTEHLMKRRWPRASASWSSSRASTPAAPTTTRTSSRRALGGRHEPRKSCAPRACRIHRPRRLVDGRARRRSSRAVPGRHRRGPSLREDLADVCAPAPLPRQRARKDLRSRRCEER